MYIKWFDELCKEDVMMAGGKGANLGELVRIGMPVPPGFVITSEAYDTFLVESKIKNRIFDLSRRVDIYNYTDLQVMSKQIREIITETPMPKTIENEIWKNYRKLCGSGKSGFVAVRSSATSEDLPNASFAGQLETYLNVMGDEIIKYAQKCWSSLFTPRVIIYARSQGFDHSKISIAMIVQKMVNAEKAGVLFTIDPVLKDKNKIIIESVWGLGEGIVSGRVTPDHYVVDKSTGRLISKVISKKEIMFATDEISGKTVEKEVPINKVNTQTLAEAEVENLNYFGIKIEKHYEFPQDIEWAIEAEKIFVLQTRPVTAL